MMEPIRLDITVPDVPAAVRFYERALAPESVLEAPDAVELWLAGGGLVLRVVDEATHAPARVDKEMYDKGKTPRLEILVDDVDERVDRMVAAGATVSRRLVPGEDGRLRSRREGEGPTLYASVIDPFGHLWAIAAPEEEEEDPETWG